MRSWPSRPARPRGPRPKRGVSTVAGALFFIIIAMTIITGLLLWSMDTQRRMNDLDARRLSQNIVITDVSFPDTGVVNITVRNEGPEPVLLVAVWIIDKTDNTHTRIDLEEAYPPDGVVVNTGDTESFTVDYDWTSGHTYVVKVITHLGRAFVRVASP